MFKKILKINIKNIMNQNYIYMQIKFINLELSNIILNDLLDLINKYKIKYDLKEYIEYEYIKKIQTKIYCICLIINNISITKELENFLDLLITIYSSKYLKYLIYIYNNKNISSIRINKKGKKIYTKKQSKNTFISWM